MLLFSGKEMDILGDSFQFQDKAGRTIELIKDDFDCIKAMHDDKMVGQISFEVSRFDNYYGELVENAYPDNAHVRSDYQKAGIATEMIKFATNFYTSVIFAPDNGFGAKSGSIYYSEEGSALKFACERAAITKCAEEEER